jgi:LuxR family transcriptional regulator, maltose regulon positive regulatory protein
MSDILTTKLYIPRTRPNLVLRPRLTKKLLTGMDRKLTLICAPAGFGKTTVLSEWIPQSDRCVTWVSLDEGDNDPARFWVYFVSALQTMQKDLGRNALGLLQSVQSAPTESILTSLLNEITTFPDSFAQVLDDYQVIHNQRIHDAVYFLVEHMPPHMHLVITSRTDPPLPLARWRARHQLNEIRADDLRFTNDETKEFLDRAIDLRLSAEEIDALEERTEGWIAGLQLVALALQSPAKAQIQIDVSEFIQTFSGKDRYIGSYLVEEVLNQRPKATLNFLLRTSILDRLCGPLCDAVLGIETPHQSSISMAQSQAVLERLEQANMFILPLDNEQKWYRYHHLFADVLRVRLQESSPELIPELHQRAAAWYESNGFLVEALDHSLAAGDWDQAARLIEKVAPPTIVRGQVHTALGWLKKLPDNIIRDHPALCVIHTGALMFTNQFEAAESRLRDGEQYVAALPDQEAEQIRIIRGKLAMTRATLVRISGNLKNCVDFALQSLSLLPEAEVFWRAAPLVHAASAYLINGDVSPMYEEQARATLEPARVTGNLFTILRSITNLARLQALQGQLHKAVATYKQALQAAPTDMQLLIGGAAYYFGLASLYYEWNELEAAEQCLRQGIDQVLGTITVDADVITWGYITTARLRQANGDEPGALEALETLAQLAEQRRLQPYLKARSAAAQARIWLAQGNLPAAIHWAESNGIRPTDEDTPYYREAEYLAMARVQIAQGREHPDALPLQEIITLLDRILQAAETGGRRGSVIEILNLRAQAYSALKMRTNALADIERALLLAEPEGYIRSFVDEGEPLRLLISEFRSMAGKQQGRMRLVRQSTLLNYADSLLSAFSFRSPLISPASSISKQAEYPQRDSLQVTLSERELEVLRLIAEGASNRDIAERLVIADPTVKRHVSNIFNKLGVSSRTQAVAAGREMGLL